MECKCETCIRKDCPERTTQDDLRVVIGCNDYIEHKITNADRIRAMSDEELAEWLARTQIANVAEALEIARIPFEQSPGLKEYVTKECLEWLKQPAEVDGNG